MEADRRNTPDNKLGPGIIDEQISEAVRKSGYPLQTVIASSLGIDFFVQEEWSFLDDESGSRRSLDIWACRGLSELQSGEQPLVRPTLDLLIECKQSDLPFVFFASATRPRLGHFPYFAGLFQYEIVVSTNDDRSTWRKTIVDALGVQDHPFMRDAVESCTSMSRCVRKGSELELSGTDAYQNVVLPLVKALRYFEKQQQPPKTAQYFDCHIPLAIAVIDAPMVTARAVGNVNILTLTPWVRVVRNEAVEADHSMDRVQSFGVDVVHRSFFDTYLQQHAIPFAREFARLAQKHHIELATGGGFVSGMRADSLNIEPRLRPKK
jgi:hypothetical protein